jgi:copper homeostasis protein
MPNVLVEVCVDSVACAIAADRGGADRVELCANLLEGGTTPSAGTIATVRGKVSLPVVVLIRPRAGDFLYTGAELEVMRRDIAIAKDHGAAGIATGVLTSSGRIDADVMRALISEARPMSVTFHRAFDLTNDPMEALDQLIELGVDRVLTSGAAPSAERGMDTIARLVEHARGRIIILAGGGVTATIARLLVEHARVPEVHVRAAAPVESAMQFRRDSVVFGKAYAPEEYRWNAVSDARVREIVSAVA